MNEAPLGKPPRATPQEFYQYFGGTAPTHHLYGLRAALDLIHGEGLQQVWARHATLLGLPRLGLGAL